MAHDVYADVSRDRSGTIEDDRPHLEAVPNNPLRA